MWCSVICGVQVAVPGARRLLLPTRTKGRARSHGGAGHYSAARDRRVLDHCAKVDMIITGRGSKICSNCTARCGTKVGKIGLDILYIRCKNTKRCCGVYVSSILLWLETSKVLNLVFCGSSIPFQYRINREYYSGWETHCHLVYGFEFLLSAKSFLSLLNQRKIKMTVIFVVPNTQCFSMTRDDIWWVGMSTEAHKLKLI